MATNDKVIATITLLQIVSEKQECINYNVYNSAKNLAVEQFTQWICKLNYSTFEIKSTLYDFWISFSVSDITSTDKYTIKLTSKFNTHIVTQSFKTNNKLDDINIENMSDIISLLVRISTGCIPHFIDKTILDLITMQMERIATQVQ